MVEGMNKEPILIRPIGIIHSQFRTRGEAPRQGRGTTSPSTIEIFPEYAPALGTLAGITHIWVLYWMDRARAGSPCSPSPRMERPQTGLHHTVSCAAKPHRPFYRDDYRS